jgi:hypothetical protein
MVIQTITKDKIAIAFWWWMMRCKNCVCIGGDYVKK